MKLSNKLFVVTAILLMGQYALAQPPARKRDKAKEKTETPVPTPGTRQPYSKCFEIRCMPVILSATKATFGNMTP